VTAVAKGSPADGILNCNDVILGIGDKCFDGDARIQFAKAITVAEQMTNSGILKLIRWRAGKTEPVQLKLTVMGSYSGTAPALNTKEVAEVITAGRDYFLPSGNRGTAYEGRTTDQLLTGLSSWSPAVRKRSAQALGKSNGNFVPALLKLLASSNRYARYGAFEALGYLGPKADAAAPQLRALLKDPDPWLKSMASLALPALGPKERKASITDLLIMAASPTSTDPRWTAQRTACMALFSRYPGQHEPNPIAA